MDIQTRNAPKSDTCIIWTLAYRQYLIVRPEQKMSLKERPLFIFLSAIFLSFIKKGREILQKNVDKMEKKDQRDKIRTRM